MGTLSLGAGGLGLSQVLLMAVEVGGLTAGFGIGLAALRRFLYSDAEVDRRRSVVAGLCSPLYLLLVSLFTQGADALQIAGWSLLTGVVLVLALFFPWLTRTRDSREDDAPDPGKDLPPLP